MPAWLIPLIKTLPQLATIAAAAAPAFTKKNADTVANQTMLLQQQITELQNAASGNDAHIKELAEQIQNTVEILEKGSSLTEKWHRRIQGLCIAALALSVISLGTASIILFAR